ncbi:kinase domain protein (macronuclear) [Tetrahymena thermophila SB210]|uniref:non-specific serine/threonine protein kinase n=1 Tax=Tetrahymena thermophila (strain SB210) TaxID=312017 RepID=I7M446_TETTS|nr:kinase domain protein [Tetrahymena thermophila SB210]EAS04884.1 kinase domain protein [Tetrahymena thermophila SB210]|eukprot:XP_001025129.1 kinase domain protein [Tetrahymena thermophila SB210]
MGNQNCQSNSVQVENNINSISRQFDVHIKNNQGAQGEIIIAEDKAQKHLYAVQSFIFSDQLEMEQFIQKTKIFKKLKHTNLVRLKKIQRAEHNSMCTEQLLVNLFFEHYERDLLSEYIFRSLTKQHLFTLEEITFILKSLVSALAYLQIHKIAYQNLNLKSILITNEGNIKLNEHFFTQQYLKEKFKNPSQLKIDQHTILPIQNKNKTSQLNNKTQIQPKSLKQLSINPTNIYKENVFSLGCLMLNLCVNQNIGISFHQNSDSASQQFINQQLSLVEKMYSYDFAQILCKMLVKNDEKRPDFIELAEKLGVINKPIKSNVQEYKISINNSDMSSYSSSADQKENNQGIFHDCQHQKYERVDQYKQQKSNYLLCSIQQQNDVQMSQQCSQQKQTSIKDCYILGKKEFIKIENQQPSPKILIQENNKCNQNLGQIDSQQQTQHTNCKDQFNLQKNQLQQKQLEIDNNFGIGKANKFLMGKQNELEERTKSVFIPTQNYSLIQSVQITENDSSCRERQMNQLNDIQKNQFLERRQSQIDQSRHQMESIIIYESNKISFRDQLQSNGSVIIESVDGIRQNSDFQFENNQMKINQNFERQQLYSQVRSPELVKKELNTNIFPLKSNSVNVNCNQQKSEEEQNKLNCNQSIKRSKIDQNEMNSYQQQIYSIQCQNLQYLNSQQSEYLNNNLSNQSIKLGNNFQNQLQNEIDSDDFSQIQSVAEFYKNDLEGEGVILLQNNFRFYGYFIKGKAQGKCYILDQNDQIVYEGFYQDGVLKTA